MVLTCWQLCRYELEDLHVVDVLPQMVALSETYVQVYQQQHMPPVNLRLPTKKK